MWTSLRLPLSINAVAYGVSVSNWVNIVSKRQQEIIIFLIYSIQSLLKVRVKRIWILGFTGQDK